MMSDTYYSNVNPELLEWLPLNADRVLELGCGEAALAGAYRLRNPNVHYTAAEFHAPSAAIARTRVDRLLEGDVEELSDAEILGGDKPFDAIVMGDVLEHLSDPWRILRRLHNLLSDEGHIVLCVPNIAHWHGLVELMSGRWPARDSGLFDRTHLRFFTRESLMTILQECRFEAIKLRSRNVVLDRSSAENAIAVLATAAEGLGLDRRAFVERANALQYVIVARKSGRAVPTQNLYLHLRIMAPKFLDVRTHLPATALNSLPNVSANWSTEKAIQLPKHLYETPKICIIQRGRILDVNGYWRWLRERCEEGWIFVAECDDHPALLGSVLGPDVERETWLSVTSAHAVQTSTSLLGEVFAERNPNVAVFPNAVFSLPSFTHRPGPVRVFLGALNREKITAEVARSLSVFCNAHPEVHFVVVHDQAFFDNLPTLQKTFYPALDYEAYLSRMSECHISLMPLEGTFGETFKSDIKFLEASSRGLVSIASPAVYADTIVDGETGFIAAEIGDWGKLLTRIAADEALRERLAQAARSYVKDRRMFASQVITRRDWYSNLWKQREQLNAALFARHPELARP